MLPFLKNNKISISLFPFSQEEDAWLDKGCRVVESNSSHSDCECSHLTSFALRTSTSGLVGSEVARSIGSGILFDSDTFVSGNPGDEDDAARYVECEERVAR